MLVCWSAGLAPLYYCISNKTRPRGLGFWRPVCCQLPIAKCSFLAVGGPGLWRPVGQHLPIAKYSNSGCQGPWALEASLSTSAYCQMLKFWLLGALGSGGQFCHNQSSVVLCARLVPFCCFRRNDGPYAIRNRAFPSPSAVRPTHPLPCSPGDEVGE